MSWILAAALMAVGALVVFVWAYVDLAARYRSLETRNRRNVRALAVARRDRDDHLAGLKLVLHAHARDIVLDPLGSDLIPEPSLRMVRGQR